MNVDREYNLWYKYYTILYYSMYMYMHIEHIVYIIYCIHVSLHAHINHITSLLNFTCGKYYRSHQLLRINDEIGHKSLFFRTMKIATDEMRVIT